MTEQEQSARLARSLEQALLSIDRLAARSTFTQASASLSPLELVEKVIIPALERIGVGWERGDVALSQVYMSGRICEELVEILLPSGRPARGDQPKLAVTVLQDYHLLGKRIVYSVLRSGGFEVLDYGRVSVDDLLDRVKRDGIQILLISTLMLSSALMVKKVRHKLDRGGADVKIVVGGAPFRFDDQLWQEVGADAMGRTAAEAIEIVSRIARGSA